MSARVTAVILTYNARDSLLSCLSSVQFCDEILIADDGSSDGTLSLAREKGIRSINLEKTASFAQKRNQALQEVSTPWALFVDSDEQVTMQLQAAIQNTLAKSDTYCGYRIKRIDQFQNRLVRHGEVGALSFLRLARVDAGHWINAVHEVWDVGGKVGELDGVLLHTPHADASSFFAKISQYAKLQADQYAESLTPTLFNRLRIFAQLLCYPVAKFFLNYFFRLGFLDGTAGLLYASMMSLHSLFVRIYLLEQLV